MVESRNFSKLLPRIIPISNEDIKVRKEPKFLHQKVMEFITAVEDLGLTVTVTEDNQVEILTDDYKLVAFPHIFLFWNVLIFVNSDHRQYFSVLNSRELLAVLKKDDLIELLK